MLHYRQIVRDEHIGQPQILLQIHHQIQYLRPHRDIKGGDRFIGNHHVRVKHQPACDSNTLPLSARKHVRVAIVMFSFQTDLGHHLQRFLTTLRAV
ncbi:hypothetical protein D3C81_2086130 [compost metagenome]